MNDMLSRLLIPERVLSLPRLGSQKRAFEHLSEMLAEPAFGSGSAVSGPSVNDIFSCLLERERLGSTGLGHGVALPHGRLAGIDAPRAAFLRLSEALDYDGATDARPVDLIMALLFPDNGHGEHLEILALAARMFSDVSLCERLRSAPRDQDLFDVLVSWQPSPGADSVARAEGG